MFSNMDLSILLSTSAIYAYCGAIIVITSYSYWNFRRALAPITKELNASVDRIGKTERQKEAFPEDYYEFKEWMDKTEFLKDSWREFEETLLIPGEDFEDDKTVILNTQHTSIHFNQRNILWHKVNMRFYNALPNMLTGLGIIGTFLGLAIGIYIAAPGLNSEHIEDAKSALNHLLSGASLAFITSIVGLFCSLIFSLLEKKKLHKFNMSCQKLVSEIDARVEYFSAERLASKSLNESQKQSLALETFANDLAVSLGQVIEQQVSRPMVAAINELKEEQKSANDETLEKLITEFSNSITGAAGEEMKAFASTMDSVSSNLEQQMNLMVENQAQMQEVSQQTVVNMAEVMTESSKKIKDEITATMNSVSSNIEQQMNDMMSNQTKMQDASQKAVVSMADAMSEGSKQITEEINVAVSSLAEGISKSLEAVSNQLNNAAEVLSEKLSESIGGFDGVLNKIEDISGKYEKISENTSSLHADLNSSVDKARETVSLAGEVNNAFNQSIEELTGYTENISKSSTSMKDASSQMLNLVDQINNVQDSIKSHWESYNDRFEAVDVSLSNSLTAMRDGLDGYASSTNEYVLGLDKHAAQVVQDLSSAVQEVNDSMELITETLETQKQSFLKSVNTISNKALSNMELVTSQQEKVTQAQMSNIE